MGFPRYTFDFSSWNAVNADRWDCANLHWNQSQAHSEVYPFLFYTPNYEYKDFIKYDTYNFSATAPDIRSTLIGNHYKNLAQGGRGFFDKLGRFSFDNVLNYQYMTPPVYAPGYGFVNGGYSPSYPGTSNGTNTTTPETAEEKVAKSRYDKLSAMVTALANSGKFSDSDKATLEVALKGNSEHKTYVDKYNYLKGEYDKIVKDDTTRAKVRKILINAGLGSGNSVIVSASSNESVNKQLVDIGNKQNEETMKTIVNGVQIALGNISKENFNSNLVEETSKDNVLNFISTWNDNIGTSFVDVYKKAVKDVENKNMKTATEGLRSVANSLIDKANSYITEDSVLDSSSKTALANAVNSLKTKLYSNGLPKDLTTNDFTDINTTFNELYVKTRLAAATVLGNDLAKTYGAIDSNVFKVDMFINETKKDLNNELSGNLKSVVNSDSTALSATEKANRKKEAESGKNTLKASENNEKVNNNDDNNQITETNFKTSVNILIRNGDIKDSINTIKIDGRDEKIYSQTVNGETKYYIISGTTFKEVENVTMDSSGRASIEKDGENEKTPNVKDEEISAKTLENNKQPEKDAKKATEGMTNTNCTMSVAGNPYTVYSLKTKDKETKYYIQMDNNFHEITGVTESKDGNISVENAKIENSATSAATVKEQVEEVENAKPKLQELNAEEVAEAMNMAKDVHNAVNSSEFWNMFDRYGEIKTPLTKCSEKNVVRFYKEYLKINNNKFDLINKASANSGLKNLLSAVKDLAKTFNITPENNEDLKLLVQYEDNIGRQGLNRNIYQDTRIKLDAAFTNLMNIIINNSNS